ncbi:MAG: hypothetical protein H6726_20285 [Sandaracinaceae bacterium]|nr:hypothetical protein [Sandaracinaceae bacterium]
MTQGEALYARAAQAELLRTDHSIYEVRVKGDPDAVRKALEMEALRGAARWRGAAASACRTPWAPDAILRAAQRGEAACAAHGAVQAHVGASVPGHPGQARRRRRSR